MSHHRNRRFRPLARLLCVASIALVFVWLGCAGLLDIDDGRFVPLPDAGAPETPSPPLKVVPSRRVVRVHRGMTNTFEINVELAVGKAELEITPTAIAGDGGADLTLKTDPTGDHKFIVTLSASKNSGAVDSRLRIVAKADGKISPPEEVRVLVGLPGDPDKSFGTTDTGAIDTGPIAGIAGSVLTRRVFAVVGQTAFVATSDGKVREIAGDGTERELFTLEHATGSGPPLQVTGLAADSLAIDVATLFNDAIDELTTAPRSTIKGGIVPGVSFEPRDLFAIARHQGSGWHTTNRPGDAGGSLLYHRESDAAIATPIATPSSLIALDGGFLVLGTQKPNHRVARVRDGGFDVSFGGAQGARVPVVYPAEEAKWDTKIVGGAVSTSGQILILTQETNAEDPTYPAGLVGTVFAPDAGVSTPPFEFMELMTGSIVITGDVVADRRNRFVVAVYGQLVNDTPEEVLLQRLTSTGSPDLEIDRRQLGACEARPLVAIDDEGMILVLCPGIPSSRLYRRWP